MGFFALIKFIIPIIIDGVKEIAFPKAHADGSRTSLGIRISILIILILLLLLGYVTDKLYLVHTNKVEEAATITILKDQLREYRKKELYDCDIPPYIPKTKEDKNVIKSQNTQRDKMIYEINQH